MAHQCPFRYSSLNVDVQALSARNRLVISIDWIQDLACPAGTTEIRVAFPVELITVAAFAHPANLASLRTIAASETPFTALGTLTAFLTGDICLVTRTRCVLAGALV